MSRELEPADLVVERSAVEARGIPGAPPRVAATAAAADLEPPWFTPDIGEVEWETFARYPNYLAAQIVAGLLENEGLFVIVETWTAFPLVGSAAVWVPKTLMHRARWIVAQPAPSDAELLFLATGELSATAEQE